MGKTRDLLKKIRDTKRTFHAKLGSIKDRNGMDLAEDIKKRQQGGGAKMVEEEDADTPTNSLKKHLNIEQTAQKNF